MKGGGGLAIANIICYSLVLYTSTVYFILNKHMPITSSAKKALRNSEKKRVFNLRRKKNVADLIKEVKGLAKANDKKGAEKLMPSIYKALDKAAKGNTIKKNTASRKKSRISKLVKSIS